MKKLLWVLVFLAFSSGCDALKGVADFHISISNRNSNTIMVYGNGIELGPVGPGRADAFIMKLELSGGGYTSPSSRAFAIFAARDVVTGKLSSEKRVTLTEGRPENIEFNTKDFQ